MTTYIIQPCMCNHGLRRAELAIYPGVTQQIAVLKLASNKLSMPFLSYVQSSIHEGTPKKLKQLVYTKGECVVRKRLVDSLRKSSHEYEVEDLQSSL